MTHLYLHIGMHKTGTSSIQETLFRNRALLAEAGYAMPDGRGNQSGLLYTAFSSTPEKLAGWRKQGVTDREALAPRSEKTRARLDAFLRGTAQPRAVMSGEALSRLAPGDVRRMLEFFRARVERITVIGFVRPPRSFMVSAIQQRIRGGRGGERVIQSDWPKYRAKFAPYLEAADLAETRLAVYARSELVRGCSVATLLALADAPPDLYGRLDLHQENLSMSRAAAVLTLALNSARHRAGEAAPGRAGALLVPMLRGLPGPRFTVPDAVLDAHLCVPQARRQVAWMERQLGRSFAAFEAPIPKGRPDHLPDPEAWAAANLTWLTRAETEALHDLLRRRFAPKDAPWRRRAAAAFGPAIAWLETRLAAVPGGAETPLLTAESVRELAVLLAEADRRMAERKAHPDGEPDGESGREAA